LAQVTALLNRAVTLATEAATGTVSDPQRTTINAEFTAIKAEIDRIGSSTNYNGGQVFTATATAIYLSDGTAGDPVRSLLRPVRSRARRSVSAELRPTSAQTC